MIMGSRVLDTPDADGTIALQAFSRRQHERHTRLMYTSM